MNDLFGVLDSHGFVQEELAPVAILLRGKALASQDRLLAEIEAITNKAPFRNMVAPGGYVMSVAMTNCGATGWVTDRSGYRYDRLDLRAAGLGRPCQIAFSGWPSRLQQRLDIWTLCRTPASSTVMHLGLACRFIRTRTNAISRIRSYPSHSGCRRHSSSAASNAPIRCVATRFDMATSRFGVAHPACAIMAFWS